MMQVKSENDRFPENSQMIYDFGNEFLVVCPKCGGMAKVISVPIGSEKINSQLFAPRQFICLNCVHRDIWKGNQISLGGNFDWYFRFPLWLEISCCGKSLWAYNEKHLEFLENYIKAKLRERIPNTNKSLVSRLPTWLKSAKNRNEILKAITRLRTKLT
jgi:hypothetical protein